MSTFVQLAGTIKEASERAKAQVLAMRGKQDINIGEMFEMQMTMHDLVQLSEMSTGIVAAAHGAVMSVARNIK